MLWDDGCLSNFSNIEWLSPVLGEHHGAIDIDVGERLCFSYPKSVRSISLFDLSALSLTLNMDVRQAIPCS
jgi:hypothetical protein